MTADSATPATTDLGGISASEGHSGGRTDHVFTPQPVALAHSRVLQTGHPIPPFHVDRRTDDEDSGLTPEPLAAGRRAVLETNVGDGDFTLVPWVQSGVFRRI